MTVTTLGVKGYEYQYKATTIAALHHLHDAQEIFIEKKGSEDATMIITQNGKVRSIEIQSKNSSAPITIPLLTDWLCHFQERSATDNLLSRLIKSSETTVLIITSARCNDSTEILRKPVSILDTHADLKLQHEWKSTFLKALEENRYKGRTSLQKHRNEFCKGQARDFAQMGFPEYSLRRFIIWEQINDVDIDRATENILNKVYNIPQSLTNSSYLELLDAVRDGRDKGVNILPRFKQLLALRKGEAPFVDAGYHSRNEEKELIIHLERDGLLLLTGRTQCGKSEIAKEIATHFYEKGYAYRICTDVNGVDSFFNQYSIEDKICILEDPWGHVELGIDSLETFRKLETLVNNGKQNHKLIITTREEILNKLKQNYQRVESIKGAKWHNITISDKHVIAGYWQKFAQDRNLDAGAQAKIANEILTSSHNTILQIGELQHLVRYDQDLGKKSLEELLHIARQTSDELASDLMAKNPTAAELLAILGSCTDTTTSLSILNLGYIISTDNKEYSIRSNVTEEAHKDFPIYSQDFPLSAPWIQELEYLENRGLVHIRSNNILFSHPNYVEAAKKLLIPASNLRQERILGYLKKAITSISPQNALKAVKQLNYILETASPDYHNTALDLAFLALDSIFPAVRDQSLSMLASKLSNLSTEKKNRLERLLDSPDSASSSISWWDGIPYISENSDTFQDRFFQLDKSEYSKLQLKFSTDQFISSLEAWNYIRTVHNTAGVTFTIKEANYLMRYDETFIRKKTTEIVIGRSSRIPDEELMSLILSDQHPSVIFTAIKTILQYWKYWDMSVKPNLKGLLISSLCQIPVAIRCNQLLTTFETKYSFDSIPWEAYTDEERKELWNIWGELYPQFILKLPANAFLNPGRFGNTIDTAFKYLEKDNGMAVLNAWYERIDYKINENKELDEYELAIADVLFDFTGDDFSSRAALLDKLLTYNDTGFIISTLKWTVSHWDKLNNDEREKVINLIRKKRHDNRWIKAIVITRHSTPPASIQLALFGNPRFFNHSTEDFINSIDTQLLEDCLKVYFGHPQPLWWYATQYNNVDFWQPIVTYILKNNIEPYFTICIREISSWGLNGFSAPWQDGLSTWKTICERSSNKADLAKRLIYDTSRITYVLATSKKMYSILIAEFVKNGNENEIIQLLVDNIELLQHGGYGANDLLKILDPDIFNKIYSRLQPDARLYIAATTLKKDPSKKHEFPILLADINRDSLSVRFRLTKKVIKDVLSELSLLSEFEEQIANISDNIMLIHETKAKALAAQDEYKLPDWIGIN